MWLSRGKAVVSTGENVFFFLGPPANGELDRLIFVLGGSCRAWRSRLGRGSSRALPQLQALRRWTAGPPTDASGAEGRCRRPGGHWKCAGSDSGGIIHGRRDGGIDGELDVFFRFVGASCRMG